MKKFKVSSKGTIQIVEAEIMQSQIDHTVTFWNDDKCVAVFYNVEFASEVHDGQR